jgi:adhesin transport system membrane fusion protein
MAAIDRHHWIDPADSETGKSVFGHLLLIAIGVLVVVFLVWSNFAVLDEVTRGDGRVIPSSQVQVLQNLEGGIVSEILVREGDIVEKDQVVMRIDNTLARSTMEELQTRSWTLMAMIQRLEVEAAGGTLDDMAFPQQLIDAAPDVVQSEMSLFEARLAQLDAQLATLTTQAQQREQEIAALGAKAKGLQQAAALANKELKIMRPLATEGVVSQVDLLAKERELNDIMIELNSTQNALPSAKSAQKEAENRIAELAATFRATASEELNSARAELASVTSQLTADTDRARRTEVTSPVKGTVKEIKLRTLGAVARPGEDLMEIVPLEDTLLVEAQIRPADIAFIRPGQKATIKITAYDFGIYGGLEATVEQISADTIEDEEGNRFFRVRMLAKDNSLGDPEHPLPIIPGMTASVDILTGEKTVFQYLMKPILKAKDTALRER